jgi:hypothetical protein
MIPIMLAKCACAGLCFCAAAVTGIAICNIYSNKTNENITQIDSIV